MKPKDIRAAVREICLSLPEAEERAGKRMPDYLVRGKVFALLAVNHHGDGNTALWLPAPRGAQQLHVEMEPEHYFVPPYVGPRGWLGVHLDRGNDWLAIESRVREAYAHVAPAEPKARIGPPIDIDPPEGAIDPEDFDPLLAPHAQALLSRIREFCDSLPETTEDTQFGKPSFKAGKKTFLCVHRGEQRLRLQFRVGPELQATLTEDPRFTIPMYIGHRGWIDLDVEEHLDWEEVQRLVLGSYRHFALKRMLKALDAAIQ